MKHITAAIIILSMALAAIVVPASASDAFVDGLALFNAGECSRAADQLLVAVSKDPGDPVVRLTAGVALANQKRYIEAIEQFRSAARVSPNSVLPLLLLDGTCSEVGNVADARAARETAARMLASGRATGQPSSSDQLLAASLGRNPNNAIAMSLLGDMYQLQGKLQLAKDQYSKASDLAPKWVKPIFNLGMANLQTDAKAAESDFGRVIRMDPSNSRAYLWQGDAYLRQGKFGDAMNAYGNAARDKALANEARTRIGNAELRAGNYPAASEQFAQAAQLAPQDPRPLAGQAQALENTGNLKEAEWKYKQAAVISASNQAPPPSQAVLQRQIAGVRLQQGKLGEAVENLRLGFELHPTREDAESLVLAQQKSGRLTEGIAEFAATLKQDPKNKPAMVYLLSAYLRSENWTAAINMASRLARADPANACLYHADTGAVCMRLGDTPAAVEAYLRAMNAGNAATWPETARSARDSGALAALEDRCKKAFEANPKRSTGVVLFELRSARGDGAGMVEVADRLTKLYPDDPTLWLRLGQAWEQSDNKDLALAAYARAASGPDPEAAAAARSRAQAMK